MITWVHLCASQLTSCSRETKKNSPVVQFLFLAHSSPLLCHPPSLKLLLPSGKQIKTSHRGGGGSASALNMEAITPEGRTGCKNKGSTFRLH